MVANITPQTHQLICKSLKELLFPTLKKLSDWTTSKRIHASSVLLTILLYVRDQISVCMTQLISTIAKHITDDESGVCKKVKLVFVDG